MTKSCCSIKLLSVRWIVFALILSLLFGFQQRPFIEMFGNAHTEESHDHHEDMQASVLETFEILLTGSLTHTHEHEESEGDSRHEHSHEHHFNGTTSSAVFILVQVHFSFPTMDLVWDSAERSPDLNPYYAEILKPPIFA